MEYKGTVHRITSRGNDRKVAYLRKEDRELFLGILAKTVKMREWECHAYYLMDNHYHNEHKSWEGK
jgi:hypothetical protein